MDTTAGGKRAKRAKSRGAILVVALLFLLLLALVAATVMQNSLFEVQMAGNDQFREEAFQRVEAITTAIAADIANFPVVGGVGYTICKTGAGAGCDLSTIALTSAVTDAPAGVQLNYTVVRLAPLYTERPWVRRSERDVCGASCKYAYFETNASYAGGDLRLGNAAVARGVELQFTGAAQ